MSTQPEALTLVERLRNVQTNFGASRRQCDELGQAAWDSIDAAIAEIERLTAAHHAAIHRANDQFDRRQKAEAERDAAQADAKRYRWLKSRNGLTLRSEKQPNTWTRMDGTQFNASHSLAADGTQYAPAATLDALIDAAIAAERTQK